MIDTAMELHPVDKLTAGDKLADVDGVTGEIVDVAGKVIVVQWADYQQCSPYTRPGLRHLWDCGEVTIVVEEKVTK